jgi:hypothetical protein
MTCRRESQTFAPIVRALGSTPNRRRVAYVILPIARNLSLDSPATCRTPIKTVEDVQWTQRQS